LRDEKEKKSGVEELGMMCWSEREVSGSMERRWKGPGSWCSFLVDVDALRALFVGTKLLEDGLYGGKRW
jgi:hypothetical protein